MRDAIHERARLAGAGSGNDQERSITVRGRRELLGVQFRREISPLSGNASFSRGIDERLGHSVNIGSGGIRGRDRFLLRRFARLRLATTRLLSQLLSQCEGTPRELGRDPLLACAVANRYIGAALGCLLSAQVFLVTNGRQWSFTSRSIS